MSKTSGRLPVSENRTTERTARVVPNVPSFAVDKGFWYSIPDQFRDDVKVGRLVRIPLSGRRVRGWVVELGGERSGKLKPIAGVSGDLPVFDDELLKTLLWCAQHYVAPVSVLLGRSTPPNLPKAVVESASKVVSHQFDHPLSDIAESLGGGARRPTQLLVGRWQDLEWLTALSHVVSVGRSVLVVTATVAEVERIAARLPEHLIDAAVIVSGEDDRKTTLAWVKAQQGGRVIIGTPKVATWKVESLAMVVVLEEPRRAMKDRQTPTLHVREVIRNRSLIEGFGAVFYGPTPSVEVLAAGPEVRHVGQRAWPLVEVVDRKEEATSAGYITDRASRAIRATTRAGGRVFVLTSLKGIEDAQTEALRHVDPGNRNLIEVGSERDLASLEPADLVIATNPDGMLLGRGYRAAEETLRILARLANALEPGPGRRMMVQTDNSESILVKTLRRGDPIPYLEHVLLERARAGLPPSTDMIAVEIRGSVPDDADQQLRALTRASVLGPLEIEEGKRWLVDGDLRLARTELRSIVGKWRDAGATVRVDADPIDL